MTECSGARPMPPAMKSRSLPAKSVSTGKPLPYGPRTVICYQAMKKKDWLIFLEDLADRPYGIRCFRLLDPNKNDIVIFSYLKDLEEKGLL